MKPWGVIITSFILSSMLIGCTATTTAEPEELPPVEVEAAPTPKAELYIRETITPEEVDAPTPEPTPTPEPEVEEVVTDEAPNAEPEPAPVEEETVGEVVEEPELPESGIETDDGEGNSNLDETDVGEPVNTSPERTYYGACRITFYCPCAECCGSWGNATASGATPTAGWTVANGSLPFGTQVVIDGHTYCVEDRGVGGDQFDIFVNDHSEALASGLYYTDVYLVR